MKNHLPLSSTGPFALTFAVLTCVPLLSLGCQTSTPVVQNQPTARATSCEAASLSLTDEAVVASLDGQPVTMKDLGAEAKAAEQKALQEYCDTVSGMRKSALDAYVVEKLVTAAAKAENKDADTYVKDEVAKRNKPPTDAEIQAFYDERKRPEAPPLADVKDQVMMLIERERSMEAMKVLFADLKKAAKLESKLPDVRAPARAITVEQHTPQKGNPQATIKIVEFADFQCPYCSQAADALAGVAKKYGDRVSVSYIHFPLRSIHPSAQRAAEVAQCAQEQGKFWQLHDALYASQATIADAIEAGLPDMAQKTGLDKAKLDACMSSGRATAQVEKDYQQGMALGVSGTPAVFVNGRAVAGGASFEGLVEAIEAEL